MADAMIYVPRGRALEYAPLACNLAVGCAHGCLYCYGPASFRRKPETWGDVRIKDRAIERFEQAAAQFAGDPRRILFSFATDPYGTPEQRTLMYDVLGIAARHRLSLDILTKNPMAAEQNFAMLARIGATLGTTICFASEEMREHWEPGAPSMRSRVAGLMRAREAGIKTWVSVEPVLDVREAVSVIAGMLDRVDLIKVGKWNHDARANAIDWRRFLEEVRRMIGGRPHLYKHDLLEAAGMTAEEAG